MKIRHQFRVCVSTGVLEDWGTRDLCRVLSVLTPLTVRPLTLLPPHGPTTCLLSGAASGKYFISEIFSWCDALKRWNTVIIAMQYNMMSHSGLWTFLFVIIFPFSSFYTFFASNVMLGLKSHPYNGNQLPAWGWTFFYRPGQYVCSCVGVIPWIIIYFWI